MTLPDVCPRCGHADYDRHDCRRDRPESTSAEEAARRDVEAFWPDECREDAAIDDLIARLTPVYERAALAEDWQEARGIYQRGLYERDNEIVALRERAERAEAAVDALTMYGKGGPYWHDKMQEARDERLYAVEAERDEARALKADVRVLREVLRMIPLASQKAEMQIAIQDVLAVTAGRDR